MAYLQPLEVGYAPVNGIDMYYEIYGEGKPLVLVHGGGSTIQTTFGNILSLLMPGFRLIAVELQGHGHTSDRPAPESFEQDATDIAGLMDYLRINKAYFFGFSNGGNTVMRTATLYPRLVDKLVVASAFYKREGMMNGFFESMQKATLEDMPVHLREAFLQINPNADALQRMFEKDRARMVTFKDWEDADLSAITVPTLLIGGDNDVMTVEHTIQMKRLIPNSQLLILPGTHGAYMAEGMPVDTVSTIVLLTVTIIKEFLD